MTASRPEADMCVSHAALLRRKWIKSMPRLPNPPMLRLSRLRDIGWSLWDPIGLLGPDQRWDEGNAQGVADEYDSYLIEAAGLLRRGTPDQDVVELLVSIETDHMGLTLQTDTYERAKSVVAAIKSDEELWTKSK
ncbi:hypothetical protein J2045_000283 [Peteryoungia aggregata LMG 23059]|uniref:Uncharacterized protein n=1 Tax=Peteryoungia aggregata LMG 23059 TaxID=1368425 RepID=A0ABU0G2E2_9HYPH|nr:hypothetical protein [Peteryoungia aggregata]MDQ0419273.1 hypothetical protein [Peteryoungia aggregata LMG 23059]